MIKYIYEKIDEEVKKRLKNLNEGDLTFTYEEDARDIIEDEKYYFMYEFIPELLKDISNNDDLVYTFFGNYVKNLVDFYLKLHY